MKRVKEYLEEINVPYTEEQSNGMTVLKINYGKDLLAIFPPDEEESEFHAVIAYDGKVQEYCRMKRDALKDWLHSVFIEDSASSATKAGVRGVKKVANDAERVAKNVVDPLPDFS